MYRNNRGPRIGFCYPGYRYCGPGCSGPGRPINEVDSCCKMHDKCYDRYGRTRYCDELFHQCLYQYMNPYSKKGKHAVLFSGIIGMKNMF
ncbi:Parvovirus coat protein VP1-like protein [Ureibacillus composti]|nr:Parvovirus coat protein VP1-like protein [Ureibacillus composti]